MTVTQHSAINVEIIDEAFYMPQLDRSRRIWIYKPANYNRSTKRYPVVYMHDGQNLFDDATAFGEEWGVDETLNSMLAECIIVGIDNSAYRMTEYNFYDTEEHGEGEGRKYMRFIVETLKPFIDANYRTKTKREFTNIAGSSMGGLISLYGAIVFSETFGGAGVFSPSLWAVDNKFHELNIVAKQKRHLPQRFYFYGGGKEGCNMISNINYVATLLNSHSHYSVQVEIDPEGTHSEYHWRNRFPHFYTWLYKFKGAEVFKVKRMTRIRQTLKNTFNKIKHR